MTLAANLDRITACIREDLIQVERVLHEGVKSVAPLISQIGEYTFGGGGKRVRPLLVLLAARLCGYRGPRAIQVAAAAEYLHSATLVHDDVVDAAEVRRGRPSVKAHFGSRAAVLAGDFLFARSSQMLVDDGDIDILAIYAESIQQMAEGEVLQLSSSFDAEISESLYLEVIGRKTAFLLATSSESGAILGGVTRSERRAVRDYGWQLGLAFQLVDDALDYASTREELGKAPLTDLAEGKVTLPLIVALKQCTVGERDSLVAKLKSLARPAGVEVAAHDPAEVASVAEAVQRYRGVEVTLERAAARAARARAGIEPFVDCDARRSLLELTEFVVQRRS